jgi:hypothetical protein
MKIKRVNRGFALAKPIRIRLGSRNQIMEYATCDKVEDALLVMKRKEEIGHGLKLKLQDFEGDSEGENGIYDLVIQDKPSVRVGIRVSKHELNDREKVKTIFENKKQKCWWTIFIRANQREFSIRRCIARVLKMLFGEKKDQIGRREVRRERREQKYVNRSFCFNH